MSKPEKESEAKTISRESGFRFGYWAGYMQALDDFYKFLSNYSKTKEPSPIETLTYHQLQGWGNKELADWMMGDYSIKVHPPKPKQDTKVGDKEKE